jgi:hypothetical protein
LCCPNGRHSSQTAGPHSGALTLLDVDYSPKSNSSRKWQSKASRFKEPNKILSNISVRYPSSRPFSMPIVRQLTKVLRHRQVGSEWTSPQTEVFANLIDENSRTSSVLSCTMVLPGICPPLRFSVRDTFLNEKSTFEALN